MTQVARLYIHGRLQVICAPSASGAENGAPLIGQDPETGDLILAAKPPNWTKFYETLKRATAPAENNAERTKA
jgi:antitoxin VapB